MSYRGLTIVVVAGALLAAELVHWRAQEAELAGLRDRIRELAEARPVEGSVAAAGGDERRADLEPTTRAPRGVPAATAMAATAEATNHAAARRPPTLGDLRDEMESRFSAQPVDASWSGPAQQTVLTKLGAAMPAGSSLRSVDCRASGCRIETLHGSPDDHQQFVRDALIDSERQPWNGAFFTADLDTLPDGRVIAVSFLLRPGQTLPSGPPEIDRPSPSRDEAAN